MNKLKQEDHCLLTTSILKVLSHNNITSVIEFVQEDVSKLASLTKLPVSDILRLRNFYLNKYSAPVISGTKLLSKMNHFDNYLSTGLNKLDEIIKGLPIGAITEVCGLGGSGKTQFCLQLAINCLGNGQHNVLYIDTKADFSAVRVQKILRDNELSFKDIVSKMLRIKVIHIWNMDEMIALLEQIKNDSIKIDNLKLIIIDSLPPLMLQYIGNKTKASLTLLNIFANHCKYIAKQKQLPIVCVNIQTRWLEQDILEDDESDLKNGDNMVERKIRCLGKYWQFIPALVLETTLVNVSDSENLPIEINIKVLKNFNGTCDLNYKTVLNNLGLSNK